MKLVNRLLKARLAAAMSFRNLGFRGEPSATSTGLPDSTGRSAEVTTALTPDNARALAASMDLITAWAWGLLSILPWRRPGMLMSAP